MVTESAPLRYPCGCEINGGEVRPCKAGARIWQALMLAADASPEVFDYLSRAWTAHVRAGAVRELARRG